MCCAQARCDLKNSDTMRHLRILALCSMLCALIIIGAYIRLPFPVPITLQLLFTNVGALLLGKKWGWVPPRVYLLLGLAGLPVFAPSSGIGSILSVSFGFTVGFVVGAALSGAISEKRKSTVSLIVASALNVTCVYLCGTLYYLVLCNIYFCEVTTLSYALYICVLPFIVPDIIKCALSILLYKKLSKYVRI